ncbi:Exonuclease VII, small subunit [Candidatus Omnitrophus magneticus]|uniref:Exodeoxyribonuclease 7 small subunit n=1 Tax=Candidatus Omnitrophus magneticus TaxID=1609969 RepID=A0A0F0CNL9_9BACT|nr:Exonuclease VII, small subunit [Candidatus Omnitrophus magneticus]
MTTKELSFEEAIDKLEKIVYELEEGNITLDNLLNKYEEGVKLVAYCRDVLNKTKKKIEVLNKTKDGVFLAKESTSDF